MLRKMDSYSLPLAIFTRMLLKWMRIVSSKLSKVFTPREGPTITGGGGGPRVLVLLVFS